MRLLASWIFACLAGPIAAQEFVMAEGKLSDDDFYRLVACAAEPGGDCRKPIVRWRTRDARDLSVGTVFVADSYPPRLRTQIEDGLDRAIRTLNASGADLSLRRAEPDEDPDIKVLFFDIPEGATISGTDYEVLNGVIIAAATYTLVWRDDRTLTDCYISSSNSVRFSEAYSGMLEELTQCLGLGTDIGGAYYEPKSIFSDSSNSRVRLGEQDLMALRRHYP